MHNSIVTTVCNTIDENFGEATIWLKSMYKYPCRNFRIIVGLFHWRCIVDHKKLWFIWIFCRIQFNAHIFINFNQLFRCFHAFDLFWKLIEKSKKKCVWIISIEVEFLPNTETSATQTIASFMIYLSVRNTCLLKINTNNERMKFFDNNEINSQSDLIMVSKGDYVLEIDKFENVW